MKWISLLLLNAAYSLSPQKGLILYKILKGLFHLTPTGSEENGTNTAQNSHVYFRC